MEQKLLNAAQKENEKPIEVALRVRQPAKLVDQELTEAKIIFYILRGLTQQCHTQIAPMDNSTVEKLQNNLNTFGKMSSELSSI